MAKISFDGLKEYQEMLEALGKQADKICTKAVRDASKMVGQEIKAATPVDSGDLRNSLEVTRVKHDKDGGVYAKVHFTGYDRDGVPNDLKARALESGHSPRPGEGKVAKHPFVRKTTAKVAPEAVKMMQESIEAQIKDVMNTK